MELGTRIFELRKAKGMTQTFVAAQLGRTPQWLSNIEKNRRTIGAEELHKIAKVLNVDVNLFFVQEVNATLTSQVATS